MTLSSNKKINQQRLIKYFRLVFPYLFIGVLTYFYLSFYKYYLPSPTEDEGAFLYRANDILHHMVLYKDIGAILLPGNYYFLAFIYKIFGYSFGVTRELVLIIDTIISLLLFHLSSKIIDKWFSVIPPLLFVLYGFPEVFGYYHYTNGMLLLFTSLLFFLYYLDNYNNILLLFTGIFVGLTTLFLQSAGFYAFIAIVFVMWTRKNSDRIKSIGFFVLSLSVIILIPFIYLAYKHAFISFIQDELVAARIYKGLVSFSMLMLFKSMLPVWHEQSIIIVSVFSIIGITGIILLVFKKHKTPAQTVLFIGTGVLFLNTWQRIIFAPLYLVFINSAMTMVFLIWLFKVLLDYLRTKLWIVLYNGINRLISIVAFAALVGIGFKFYSRINYIQNNANWFNVNGIELWTYNKQNAMDLESFSMHAKRIMGNERMVLVYPYSPILYTLLDLESPSKYDVLIKVGNSKGTPNAVLEDTIKHLKNIPVRFIITYDWAPNTFETTSKELGIKYVPNKLDEYIMHHYVPVFRRGGFVLMALEQ
ncbi:MAG: glycosyltransferase family 39 protein [Deltaproteobacteria bacterium]|nr:glycosyltransferase family 39 protein [Deltaproteobacteria bacterium]